MRVFKPVRPICLALIIVLAPEVVLGQSGKREYLCLRSVGVDQGNLLLSGSYGLTRNDLHFLREIVPEVASAVALRTMPHYAHFWQSECSAVVIGLSAEKLAELAGIEIVSGRFLRQQEIETADNVCVIGRRIARMLFEEKDPIGENIRLGDQYFLVVGVAGSPQIRLDSVVESYATMGLPSTQNLEIYISLPAMRMRFGDLVLRRGSGTFMRRSYELSEVWIPGATGIETIREVDAWLDNRHQSTRDFDIRARRAW